MLTAEERLRALLGNLKNWSWDVYPQFKIEKEDAEVLLNATEELRSELFGVQTTEVSA